MGSIEFTFSLVKRDGSDSRIECLRSSLVSLPCYFVPSCHLLSKRMTSLFSALRPLSLLSVTLVDGCKLSEQSLALSSAFVLALVPSYVSPPIHPPS